MAIGSYALFSLDVNEVLCPDKNQNIMVNIGHKLSAELMRLWFFNRINSLKTTINNLITRG
jgi:hypothetical protein